MELRWLKYRLEFARPAGTSRGVLYHKDSYFLLSGKADHLAIGECGLLRGLSADDRPEYEGVLDWLCVNAHLPTSVLFAELQEYPSIQFGLEMLLADCEGNNRILKPSAFTEGKEGTAINGLIWMGDSDFMLRQIRQKIEEGYSVLKLKIGAIDWATELELLAYIRKQFGPADLELRVDANGAFSAEEAAAKLEELSTFHIHSIEQPIAKGQWKAMAELCRNTPIPIALDEELIGLFTKAEREAALETIQPQYIILKPSFIGGWRGSEEWIALAERRGIGYWVTSALESNIGLNAIAQWNYGLDNALPSGLGTGGLYTNNIEGPLYLKEGQIFYDPQGSWNLSPLLK